MTSLTDTELTRYSRQIMLPAIGGRGQQKLADAKVLVIGAGGLGTPLLTYLAAAGVGTLGIVEDDTVDISNIQRQFWFTVSQEGQSKVECITASLTQLNPHITINTYATRLHSSNADTLIASYDLIMDGSDNIATRLLANRISIDSHTPLISGAVKGFEGQMAVFKGYNPALPCYECLYPHLQADDLQDSCMATGILGATAGVIGSMMCVEAIKEILGHTSSAGKLFMYDGLKATARWTTLIKDKKCVC